MRWVHPTIALLAMLTLPVSAHVQAQTPPAGNPPMIAVDPGQAPLTLAGLGPLPTRWNNVMRSGGAGMPLTGWSGLLNYSGYFGRVMLFRANIPQAGWSNNTARSTIGMWQELNKFKIGVLEGSGGSLTHSRMLVNYIYFSINPPSNVYCFNFWGQSEADALVGYICGGAVVRQNNIAADFIKAIGFTGVLTPTPFNAPVIPGVASGPGTIPTGGANELPGNVTGNAPPPTPEPSGNQGASGPIAKAALAQRLENATVMVLSLENDRLIGNGSGFFVTRNRIVTNAHVVRNARTLRITSRHLGKLYDASVIARADNPANSGDDFALLAVEGVEGTPLPLAHPADKLQDVIAAGYPGLTISNDVSFSRFLSSKGASEAPDLVINRGEVNTVQLNGRNRREVVHSAQTGPGNSGGPLIDNCGRAVGISSSILAQTSSMTRNNVALGSLELQRWLKANGVSVGLATGRCG